MYVTTFEELKNLIASLSDEEYYFRGYTDIEQLKPTLGREKGVNREERAAEAFCEFIKGVYEKGLPEQNFKDCIALSQHYVIPTKLVDLTTDPWVAVYFGLGKKHKNGRFQILYTPVSKLTSKFSGKLKSYHIEIEDMSSSTIGQISNLPLNQLFQLNESDTITLSYINSGILTKAYEKFLSRQENFNLLTYDKTVNLRLSRQKGLFVLFNNEEDSLKLDWFEKVSVDFSKEEISKTWSWLDANGYTQDQLLPENIGKTPVESIAEEVKGHYFPKS